jgi:hypothetical protein
VSGLPVIAAEIFLLGGAIVSEVHRALRDRRWSREAGRLIAAALRSDPASPATAQETAAFLASLREPAGHS